MPCNYVEFAKNFYPTDICYPLPDDESAKVECYVDQFDGEVTATYKTYTDAHCSVGVDTPYRDFDAVECGQSKSCPYAVIKNRLLLNEGCTGDTFHPWRWEILVYGMCVHPGWGSSWSKKLTKCTDNTTTIEKWNALECSNGKGNKTVEDVTYPDCQYTGNLYPRYEIVKCDPTGTAKGTKTKGFVIASIFASMTMAMYLM